MNPTTHSSAEAQPPRSQPAFSRGDAKAARVHHQRIAQIVNLIVNRIVNTIGEDQAAAFTASTFQTIHALHGMFNGREVSKDKPLFQGHIYTAPHFGFRDRSGEEIDTVERDTTLTSSERATKVEQIRERVAESASRLVCRRLNDLETAERACGRQFVVIRRADGMTQKLTSYEGHPLLDAAESLYFAARNSPTYAKNPSRAITPELLDEAIASLPLLPVDTTQTDRGERTPMDAGDMMNDAVLKGMWTKIITSAENALVKEFDTGADPEIAAKKYAAKIIKIGTHIKDRLARERLSALSSLGDEDVPWKATGDEVGAWDGKNNAGQLEGGKTAVNPDIHPDNVVTPPAETGEQNQSFAEIHPDNVVTPTSRQTVEIQEFSDTPETENSESMLDWALLWATSGQPVFPLHEVYDGICTCLSGSECRSPGKHPRTRNGVDDATTDLDQVRAMWRKYPNANIGGAMGGERQILAVDIDPRNGGDASAHDLTEAHGDAWLDTKRHKTGSGGWHLFYTIPEGVTFTKGKLAPGIDLKYTGGYVVLPPSVHLSGRCYEIDALRKPAPAPDWLIEELTRAPDVQPSKTINFQERRQTSSSTAARFFGSGERNDGLRDVACGRWTHGYATDVHDLYQQILEVRDTRCEFVAGDPPPTDLELLEMVQRTARKFPRGERASA